MKVLGLVGSPRKGGNTDTLIDRVLAGAQSRGAEMEKLYLDDLQISPCRACFSWTPKGECVIRDDFQSVVEKIKGADGMVLGSPMYVGTVTAQMKTFIDRVSCSLVETVQAPEGGVRFVSKLGTHRKGVIVAICDVSSLKILRQCARIMQLNFADLGIEVVEKILARGLGEPDQAKKRPRLLQSAFVAGEKLALTILGKGES